MNPRTWRMVTARRPIWPAGGARVRRWAGWLVVLVALVCAACGGGTSESSAPDVVGVERPSATAPSSEPSPPSEEATTTAADPVAVEAPDAAIDTSLIPVGLQPDGAMELPDPGTGAWYELGPRPGEPGPAVLVGHVDSVNGPDVFFGLSGLGAGDLVHVVDDAGTRWTFEVSDVELVPKDSLPYERIWADTDEPVLRLITCGGPYVRDAGGYQDNVVVYADLVGQAAGDL